MTETFRAYRVEKVGDRFVRSVAEVDERVLPEGSLLLEVAYSSLNYKDALSATGHPGVTRVFPHTPGIDAAGRVLACKDGRFAPGDEALVTGFDLGQNTPGGFGGRIRIPSEWAVPLPKGLSLREAMVLGTGGFTAAMSLAALLDHGIHPKGGEALVTGASGSVGTWAVALLAKAGFSVTAVTGTPEAGPFLEGLGASRILPREALSEVTAPPLLKGQWIAAVDTVGGNTLANVLKGIRVGGRRGGLRPGGRRGPVPDRVSLHHPGRGAFGHGFRKTPHGAPTRPLESAGRTLEGGFSGGGRD